MRSVDNDTTEDDQYNHMVCVEAANALDNACTLKAGESHSMKMVIAVNRSE
ncbi:MAG: hypothetical protein ACLFV1_02785 [Thiohalophilus sp.]